MKSKIKILLIGRLTINNTPCAGEVVKNQLFLGRIRELFDNVTTINLTYLTRRIQKPFLYLKMLWILLKGVDINLLGNRWWYRKTVRQRGIGC